MFGDFLHDAEVGYCCEEVAVGEGGDGFGREGCCWVAEFVDFGFGFLGLVGGLLRRGRGG